MVEEIPQINVIGEDHISKRTSFIPKPIQLPLLWILFFSCIGIIIQSIKTGEVVFFSFYTSQFIEWIRSMGTFTDGSIYPTRADAIRGLLEQWYYFFYAGGILSLIWGTFSLIIRGK